MIYEERRKTCFAYSYGGHYAELCRAIDGISFSSAYHVTMWSDRFKGESEKVYFIAHPKKSGLSLLINAVQSLFILLRERPEIVISTGADVAVPTLILSKVLFRSKLVFIESIGSFRPTLTGRIVYRFCDLFIIQINEHYRAYPCAVLASSPLL